MVDMGVREPDLAQRKPQTIHLAQQHRGRPRFNHREAWRVASHHTMEAFCWKG